MARHARRPQAALPPPPALQALAASSLPRPAPLPSYSPVLLAHPDSLAGAAAATTKAFLAATAEGYRYAAAHPAEAAALFVRQASADHPDLPQPLDPAMCVDSLAALAPHTLAADGRWGVQAEARWAAFLDWLSGARAREGRWCRGRVDTACGCREGDGWRAACSPAGAPSSPAADARCPLPPPKPLPTARQTTAC